MGNEGGLFLGMEANALCKNSNKYRSTIGNKLCQRYRDLVLALSLPHRKIFIFCI